jgi:hypothetical protein
MLHVFLMPASVDPSPKYAARFMPHFRHPSRGQFLLTYDPCAFCSASSLITLISPNDVRILFAEADICSQSDCLSSRHRLAFGRVQQRLNRPNCPIFPIFTLFALALSKGSMLSLRGVGIIISVSISQTYLSIYSRLPCSIFFSVFCARCIAVQDNFYHSDRISSACSMLPNLFLCSLVSCFIIILHVHARNRLMCELGSSPCSLITICKALIISDFVNLTNHALLL